jgi:hypothetical protein
MILYSPTGVPVNADLDQVKALVSAGYSKEQQVKTESTKPSAVRSTSATRPTIKTGSTSGNK